MVAKRRESRKRAIEERFNLRKCKRCNERFRPGCVTILAETDESVTVSIKCTCCELPLGVALIGF